MPTRIGCHRPFRPNHRLLVNNKSVNILRCWCGGAKVNYCVDSKRAMSLSKIDRAFAIADRSTFRGTLFGALKGASGPREGQKSTFSHNLFCELTFSPQHADLGVREEVRHAGKTIPV